MLRLICLVPSRPIIRTQLHVPRERVQKRLLLHQISRYNQQPEQTPMQVIMRS